MPRLARPQAPSLRVPRPPPAIAWLALALGACQPFDTLDKAENYAEVLEEVAFPGARVTDEGEVEISTADGGISLIPFVVQEGLAIAGDDIILGPAEDFLGDVAPGAAAVNRASRIWGVCTIPYSFDSSLTPDAQEDFLDAVAHWESVTPLRFQPGTSGDRLRIKDGSGCSSYVGRKGGQQDITLAHNCGRGAAIHEIAHAMGLWHEQSRADSDQHVIKHMGNVQSGKEHNFKTYLQRGEPGVDMGPYDHGSIMHYSSGAFSTTSCSRTNTAGCTITHLDGSYMTENQRTALSPGDLAAIDALYGDLCGPPPGDDHGDTQDTATPIGAGTHAGTLDAGDVDWFRLTVPVGHSVSVTSSGSTDTYGHLHDASGAEVASNDDGGEGRNFLLEFQATTGTWFLRVRGYSGSTNGPYQVVVTTAPPPDDHGNDGASATAIALDPADPLHALSAVLDAGDVDVFRIDVPAAGVLTAATTGSTDTYGTLFALDGTVLDQNDDTQGLNFAVSAPVDAGSYLLSVRGYSATTQGPYDLAIGLGPPAQP